MNKATLSLERLYMRASDAGKDTRTLSVLKASNPHSEDSWDVPVLVIPASSMDKVIERAARAIHDARQARIGGPRWCRTVWAKMTEVGKEVYRAESRAAYKAGGFLP